MTFSRGASMFCRVYRHDNLSSGRPVANRHVGSDREEVHRKLGFQQARGVRARLVDLTSRGGQHVPLSYASLITGRRAVWPEGFSSVIECMRFQPTTALTAATGGKPARGPFCKTRMRFECRMYALM